MSRIPVAKTIKLFIGGKFPRTESGRSFEVKLHGTDAYYANLCLASRKDYRDAVEAGHAALSDWSGRAAYNRGQILYRMAEMIEARREEFRAVLLSTLGWDVKKADASIDAGIDAFVYFAGFSDKFQQVASTMNPINGPFGNTTSVDAMGVTALVGGKDFDFGRFCGRIAAILAGGNTVVALINKDGGCPAIIAPLSEALATSDLPGGVVNLLTGDVAELLDVMAAHMDVRSFVLESADQQTLAKTQMLAVENLKRVVLPRTNTRSLDAILDTVEYKTVWQPVGF